MTANGGDVTLSVTLALAGLISDAKKAKRELEGILGDLEIEPRFNSGKARDAGAAAGKDFADGFESTADKLGRVLDGIFQGVGQQITQLTVQALQSAAQAVIGLGDAGLVANDKLQGSIAAVNSLGADGTATAEAMEKLSTDLNGLASQNDLTAASYDVLSSKTATLAEGLTDAEIATNILGAATKGARGGFSDTATVADALTSVLNSYQLSATEAENITAKIIATQNAGKITAGEYAAQIGRLAPTAAQAGVSIDELNGFIATATAQGVPVESTFAGIRQALSALLKPSDDAKEILKQIGITNGAAALKSEGLVGVLKRLNDAGLDTPENLNKLLGSVEALTAIAPSAGTNINTLTNNILRSQNALANNEAGKAVEAVANTAETSFTSALNLLDNQLIKLGKALAPVRDGFLQLAANIIKALADVEEGTTAIDVITEASERFTKAIEENPELLAAITDAALQLVDSLGQVTAATIDALTAFTNSPEAVATIQFLADQIQLLGNAISFVVENLEYITRAGRFLLPVVDFAVNLVTVFNQLKGVLDDILSRFEGIGDRLRDIPGIGALLGDGEPTTDENFQQRREFANADKTSAARGVTDQAFNQNLIRNRSAGTSTSTDDKASIDDQLAQLENDAKLKEAALISSGKSEEEIRKQQLANEKALLDQRIALNQQKTEELKEAIAKAEDPKEREKLGKELVQVEASIANDRLALAKNAASERQRLEREALKAIEDAVKESAAKIEQSQNDAELAVRQRQLNGVISEEEAAQEIAKIQDKATESLVAAKEQELADIRKAREAGTIDAETAAEKERDLITELGDLRVEQINNQIEAQKRAQQAELARLQTLAQIESEAAQASLDARSAAIQQQNSLYQAQVGLQQAIANFQNQQLETAITAAESAGRTAEASRLRLQLLQQQQAQLVAQQQAEAKSLILQQQAEDLAARREVIQARIAANEAEIALATARANGETEEQIRLAQQRLDLARENVAIAQQAAVANETRQTIDRARLAVEQQTASESLRGQQIQDTQALGQRGGFTRELSAYLAQLRTTPQAGVQGGLDLRSLSTPAVVSPQLATPTLQAATIPPTLNLPELEGLAEVVRDIRQYLPQMDRAMNNTFNIEGGGDNAAAIAQRVAAEAARAKRRAAGR